MCVMLLESLPRRLFPTARPYRIFSYIMIGQPPLYKRRGKISCRNFAQSRQWPGSFSRRRARPAGKPLLCLQECLRRRRKKGKTAAILSVGFAAPAAARPAGKSKEEQ